MPWCPKCRNEYREGITVCADCGVELVDDLTALDNDESKYEPLFITKDINLANKFTSYMEYSGLKRYSVNTADVDESIDDETGYTVLVHPDDYETARKLYHGFALTEAAGLTGSDAEKQSDNISDEISDDVSDGSTEYSDNNNEESDELVEIAPDHPDTIDTDEIIEQYEGDTEYLEASSSTYIRKSDRYKEYRSSAYTCILCGILGIIFTLLNILHVFNMFANLFSQIIMMTMFILFCAGGIYMYAKSNSIRNGIDEEEALESRVKTWLSINVTSAYVNGLKFENVEDEVNYLNYCKTIRNNLLEDIPEAPVEMVDDLIEDHLSSIENQ